MSSASPSQSESGSVDGWSPYSSESDSPESDSLESDSPESDSSESETSVLSESFELFSGEFSAS